MVAGTLWLDMEGSKFTDKTLEIYEDMFSRHDNLGVALQAYMKRSESDLMKLIAKGGKVGSSRAHTGNLPTWSTGRERRSGETSRS